MADNESIRFTCDVCGYQQIWTVQEVRRKSDRVVYRAPEDIDEYQVPCKNPKSPACTAKRQIGLKREKR